MNFIYTPQILQCMHFKKEDPVGSCDRTVMDYEFDLCLNCNREMWIDNDYYQIEKGCFIVRKPGQIVRSKGYYDCFMLTLDFSNRIQTLEYSRNTATQKQPSFENELWHVLPSVFKPLHFDDYVKIFNNLLSINEINLNHNENALPLINELIHLLIADSFSQSYNLKSETNNIDIVCAYVKKNYMNRLDLNKLAEIAHLNKNYLVREFKKRFGISPIAYLINTRMEYAKKFLIETNLPIKSVAASCGYNDPSFFNFYFKKTYGISPEAFRKANR